MGAWMRVWSGSPETRSIKRERIYRARSSNELIDGWERRITELADGRPVAEVIEVIYGEEIRSGAWWVDAVVWKRLIDDSVVRAMRQLADRGYIYLKPGGSTQER